MDEKGDGLGHLLKLWSDSYALEGEIKGATIALNYSRLVVTSNYSIEHIFGYDPEDKSLTEKKKHSANELVKALESRFKVVYIGSREEQAYWFTHINDLRKGKQRVMSLQAPEEEKDRPRVTIAAIDRKHTVPTAQKDFSTRQQALPSTLGKRQAEASPYGSDSEMPAEDSIPSSISPSEIADV